MLKTYVAPLAFLAAMATPAWAIHVEPDQPDLQSPKTQLVESARAAEASINGGTTSISSSGFTGFNDAVKRKAFPPGYGRSGYQFEDELTATEPTTPTVPATEGKAETQPADTRTP